jgi:HicB family
MKMSLVVDGLRSDVISVGELGDDTVAEVADRIAEVLGRSIPSRILDLLSEVAAEVSAELPDGRVEIRVAGDDVDLAYVEDAPARPADAEGESDGDRDRGRDMSARITLRLSESLKARVEEGAARQGISVNTFIVRTLEHGASGEHKQKNYARNRLRGYGTT